MARSVFSTFAALRVESERFHPFTYDELKARDKVSLDIFWLRDQSLEDTANLPPPGVIAAEIVEDLEAALAEFAEIATALANSPSSDADEMKHDDGREVD